jgi:F-type H+-transporting ATPase subunit delta
MSTKSVARRYASALFDVAQKSGATDRVGRDLTDFVTAVAGHVELGRVLASPTVPAAVKRAIMTGLLDAAGDVAPEVGRTITLLADHDRLSVLPDLAEAFAARLLEAQDVVAAEVVTAAPLAADRRQALVEALGRATGKTVTMTEQIDPDLVGGMVARVGSLVYDGSVSRQLERLRDRLMNSRQ